MKLIKLYNNFKINSICEKYNIKNYTINSDGTVDVNGNVGLSDKELSKLPLKFGKVSGYFSCSHNKLTTLEGCPQSVGGDFYCSGNRLTTLEGAPKSVGISFNCSDNKLITLEGCPQSVSSFICSYNQLTTLKGCPKLVSGYFNCSGNKLISLEFCPQSVSNHFAFSHNELSDLYGFPEFLDSDIYYSDNPVSEILDLFKSVYGRRLGKVIDLLNEYSVIQQDGKLVILDRLEEVFYTLNMDMFSSWDIPEINLENYEVD